jgi:hypothetical protein
MSSTRNPRTYLSCPWLGALFVAGLAHSLLAQAAADDNDRITVLEQKLDQSLQLIRALQARVQELEAQAAAQHPPAAAGAGVPAQAGAAAAATGSAPPAAPAANAPTDTAQRLTQIEQTVNQMAGSAGQHAEDRGMPMHGFADVGIGNHNAEFPQYQGVDIAELDFFLTPRLGTNTRALFELNFEVAQDGEVGVDLERAQIGYQFGDSATLWVGRFHTPYGYYNTAFHHGQQIATSLRRPRFIEFEDHGGIMPAHTVGMWLTGSERLSGETKVTYDLYIGNSQRITGGQLDMNNAGVTRGSVIVGGNLGVLFSGHLDGLKIGVDAFQTRIDDQDVTPEYFTQVRSYGVYSAYDTDSWENIAEFHVFNNTDLSGHTGSHHSDAGFVQLGYRGGRFTPYARYERGSFQQSDNYFAAQETGQSYYRDALGVRFDVDLVTALKMEIAATHYTDRIISSYDEILLQYAIRF